MRLHLILSGIALRVSRGDFTEILRIVVLRLLLDHILCKSVKADLISAGLICKRRRKAVKHYTLLRLHIVCPDKQNTGGQKHNAARPGTDLSRQ